MIDNGRAGTARGLTLGGSNDAHGDAGFRARVPRVDVGVFLVLAFLAVGGACGIVWSSDSDEDLVVDKHKVYTVCHSPGWAVPRRGREAGPRHQIDEVSVEWMPSGSEVVFSINSDIYAVSMDGTSLRALVITGLGNTSGSNTTAFSVAPDGSRMVYATCQFYDDTEGYYFHELALVDLSRTDASPQRLTSNQTFDYYPMWSPDGRYIAYLRGHHYDAYDDFGDHTLGGLHVVRHDGADSRAVRGGEALVGPPRWSPDGRWLAFLNDDGEAGLGLYVVNADRTVRRRLSHAVSEVSWAPDSRQLAFIRRDGERRALYTIAVAADGAAEQWVADLPESIAPSRGHPARPLPLVAWSPSGAYIAYECDDWRLCVVAPDGTRIGEALYGQAAGWSTDGSRLAMVIVDPGSLDLSRRDYVRRHLLPLVDDDRSIAVYTVAPDGSDLRPLVREHEDGGLVAATAT